MADMQEQIDKLSVQLDGMQAALDEEKQHNRRLKVQIEKGQLMGEDFVLSPGARALINGHIKNYLNFILGLILAIMALAGYFGTDLFGAYIEQKKATDESLRNQYYTSLTTSINAKVEAAVSKKSSDIEESFGTAQEALIAETMEKLGNLSELEVQLKTNTDSEALVQLANHFKSEANRLTLQLIKDERELALMKQSFIKALTLTDGNSVTFSEQQLDYLATSLKQVMDRDAITQKNRLDTLDDQLKWQELAPGANHVFDSTCDYRLDLGTDTYYASAIWRKELIFRLIGKKYTTVDTYRISNTLERLDLFSNYKRGSPSFAVWQRCPGKLIEIIGVRVIIPF